MNAHEAPKFALQHTQISPSGIICTIQQKESVNHER